LRVLRESLSNSGSISSFCKISLNLGIIRSKTAVVIYRGDMLGPGSWLGKAYLVGINVKRLETLLQVRVTHLETLVHDVMFV